MREAVCFGPSAGSVRWITIAFPLLGGRAIATVTRSFDALTFAVFLSFTVNPRLDEAVTVLSFVCDSTPCPRWSAIGTALTPTIRVPAGWEWRDAAPATGTRSAAAARVAPTRRIAIGNLIVPTLPSPGSDSVWPFRPLGPRVEQEANRPGKEPMELNSLTDVLVEELGDLQSAEQQLVEALPRLAAAAHSYALREAFETHLAETRLHVERLGEIVRRRHGDPLCPHEELQGDGGPRLRGRCDCRRDR